MPTHYYHEFAHLLEEHLQRVDRSAAWLAGRLKLTPGAVSRWLSGESRPKDPETIIRIADILGVHDHTQRQALLVAAGYGYQPAAVLDQPVFVETTAATPLSSSVVPALFIERDIVNTAAAPIVVELPQTKQAGPPLFVWWRRLGQLLRQRAQQSGLTRADLLWLAVLLLALLLLVGLLHPLLMDWPLTELTVFGIFALLVLGLIALWWRRQEELHRWLSWLTLRTLQQRIGAVGLLACSLLLWTNFGFARLGGGWGYPSMDEDGDRFGYAFATGDFNGDGLADVAAGAPGETPTLFSRLKTGWLYTFLGQPGILNPASNWGQTWSGLNEYGDRFGWAVVSGNFNGDQYMDLAVGAPGETIAGQADAGAVYLFQGTRRGLQPWQSIDQREMGNNEGGDHFGWALAAGDINGDGIDDLAVAAPNEAPSGAPHSGYVFIFIGDKAGLKKWYGLDETDFDLDEAGDQFGWSLAVADFDHDAYGDLAVGSPGKDANLVVTNAQRGRVYLFRGDAHLKPLAWKTLDSTDIDVSPLGNRFGAALTTGDFEGDGWADLAVAAPGADLDVKTTTLVTNSVTSAAGLVYIFHNTGHGLELQQELDQQGIGENQPGDRFG